MTWLYLLLGLAALALLFALTAVIDVGPNGREG
jgi:hypothetical protein